MIKNRYNRIPHSSLGTVRDRNTKKSRRHQVKQQAENQDVSSFQADVHQAILNKSNKSSKTNRSGRTIIIRISHTRSTALERSVINSLLGRDLTSFTRPGSWCGLLRIFNSTHITRNNEKLEHEYERENALSLTESRVSSC